MVYTHRTGIIVPFAHKFKKQLILLVAAVFLASMAAFTLSASAADSDYSLQGEASLVTPGHASGGALQLVSDSANATPWGNVVFEIPSGTTYSQLSEFTAMYNVTDDNCGGGSPRVVVGLDDGGTTHYLSAYVGEGASFDACTQDTWLASGDLFESGKTVDTGQFAGGTFYDSYDESVADWGGLEVVSMHISLDSSWSGVATGGDGEQTVLFDDMNLVLNNVNYVYEFEPYEETGEITNPANDGDAVKGQVALSATYDDGDTDNDDGIQWAVRSNGECNVGASTVLGNVNGHSDVADWDGASFSYEFDSTTLADGEYCFVFNPIDDNVDVRLTRTFVIDNTRPTAEFINPNGETYGDSVNVEFKMADATSGLNNMVVNIYNGSTIIGTCGTATGLAGAAEHTLNCVIDTSGYANGTYNLKGGGFDVAGNNKTISTTFVVEHADTTDPVVVLTNPEEGDVLSGVNTLEGTVTDDNNVRHRFLVRDVEDDNNVVYNSGNIFDDAAVVNASHDYDTASVPDGEYRIVLIGFDESNDARDRAVVTFENYVDSKNECKNGGWERGTFDGEEFRNQGDCVSYFTSNNGHHGWWKFWKWNHWNRGWGWFGNNFNWGWSWWR